MKNYRYRERRAMMIKRVVTIALCFVMAIALSFIVVKFCIQKYNVTGDSMEPTLKDGQHVMVHKFEYLTGEPASLDVALIRIERGSAVSYIIRRIVGLPGDKISIRDGILYVNDEPCAHQYEEKIISPGLAAYDVVLAEDEYFVMGDNCNNSEDSRKAGIGPVKKDQLIGRIHTEE